MVAAALHADVLVLLTAVPGLMAKFPDESTLISTIKLDHLDGALEVAEGRMKKKVLGAREALEGGVGRVVIADGRVKEPIQVALGDRGTVITN